MGFDLLRRVRWSNVARTGVVVAVAAAIVAWPRLAPPAPQVPDRGARPLGAAPAATPDVVEREGPRVERRRVVHRGVRESRRRGRTRGAQRLKRGGGSHPGIEGGGAGGSGGGGEPSGGRGSSGGGGSHPGIEGGGAGGSGGGGESSGGSGPSGGGGSGDGGGSAPREDPAQTEFGFER